MKNELPKRLLQVSFSANPEKPVALSSEDIYWKLEDPSLEISQVKEALETLVQVGDMEKDLGKYYLNRFTFFDLKKQSHSPEKSSRTNKTLAKKKVKSNPNTETSEIPHKSKPKSKPPSPKSQVDLPNTPENTNPPSMAQQPASPLSAPLDIGAAFMHSQISLAPWKNLIWGVVGLNGLSLFLLAFNLQFTSKDMLLYLSMWMGLVSVGFSIFLMGKILKSFSSFSKGGAK